MIESMRRLLNLLSILVVLLLPIAAKAQEVREWSLAAVWDFRTHTSSAVVLRNIGIVEKPLGLKFNLDVDGFAGADMDSNITGGVAIGHTFPVARNVDFKFGLAISATQNKPTGAGLLLGLTYRF